MYAYEHLAGKTYMCYKIKTKSISTLSLTAGDSDECTESSGENARVY